MTPPAVSIPTERAGDVEQEDFVGGLGGSISRENGSLDSGSVSNGFVGVDGLVGLFAVEEVGHKLLDLGDTGRSTDKNDFVNRRLVNLGIAKDTLDRLHGGAEEILAKLLEASAGDGGVEVDTFKEGVDLNGGLGRRRKSALSPLASSAKTTESASIGGEILLVLALELSDEVVDKAVVEVLTTQVGIASSRLNLEDTFFDGQERDIECSTAEIEDEDIALALSLLVKAIGDGGSSWLVDDTEDIEAGNQTGIFRSLAL